MKVPDWYTLLLLSAGTFRLWKLLADDKILEEPRKLLVGLRGWEEGKEVPASYRSWLGEFINCPWCLGSWLGLGWWGAWQQWPHGTTVLASLAAVLTAAGFMAQWMKGEDDA